MICSARISVAEIKWVLMRSNSTGHACSCSEDCLVGVEQGECALRPNRQMAQEELA